MAYVLENFAQIPEITWVSRTPKETSHISYMDLSTRNLRDFPLIVNTTPLGMYPNIDSYPPIAYDQLGSQHYAYDLVYNPEETQFLARAKAQGAKTLNGMPMLIGQAEKILGVWNGKEV